MGVPEQIFDGIANAELDTALGAPGGPDYVDTLDAPLHIVLRMVHWVCPGLLPQGVRPKFGFGREHIGVHLTVANFIRGGVGPNLDVREQLGS